MHSILMTLVLLVGQSERQWKSASGDHTITATMLSIDGASIKLQKNNGNEVIVPLFKLSRDDQTYVHNIYRESPDRAVFGVHVAEIDKIKKLLSAKDNFKTDQSLRKMITTMPMKGVYIPEISKNLPGNKMEVGDIIISINDQTITDLIDYFNFMMSVKPGDVLSIKVRKPVFSGDNFEWKFAERTAVQTVRFGDLKIIEAEQQAIVDKQSKLEIIGGSITHGRITTNLAVVVKNNRNVLVKAFTVDVDFYDNFDDRVVGLGGTKTFRGINQREIKALDKGLSEWDVHWYDTATKAIVRVTRVKWDDGEEWQADSDNVKEFVVNRQK